MKQDYKHFDVRADALSDKDWARWEDLRQSNAALNSPYMHPDFTRVMATLRDDVRILGLRRPDGRADAFLPVQGKRFARPVGAPMSDYHGIICAPDADLSYDQILTGTQTGALHFSAAIDTDRLRAPQVLSTEETATLEISTTAQDWRAARDGSYRRHAKSTRRRVRKAEEEIGPRRTVLFSRDIDIYSTLIRWKREKFAQTGKYDVLSADWTTALLRNLWERPPSAALRCDMHAIYFGEHLAAIDLGLSDGTTFHSWMVAYNDEFHTYAPGIQLLEALIESHAETGYRRIDLGAGLDGYKRHYASHSQSVATGFVPVSGPAGHLSRAYAATERWGEKSLADVPGKLRRRYFMIAACEDRLGGRLRHLAKAVVSQKQAAG